MTAGAGWVFKRPRKKQIIFKKVAEQAEGSCGFCRNDSWRARLAVPHGESPAAQSPLHWDITSPQLMVSSPPEKQCGRGGGTAGGLLTKQCAQRLLLPKGHLFLMHTEVPFGLMVGVHRCMHTHTRAHAHTHTQEHRCA